MKKLKIIASALCLFGQSAFAQFPLTITDIGQGGTFSNNNTTNITTICINQTAKDIKFVPSCPSGAGISNATTSTTFSALGGAQINSQTTAGTVTFQMKSIPVPGFTENRYPTGRIIADYKCSYDSTYTVSFCNSNPITTTVRISRIGRSHIDFFQIFNWSRKIVGPDCVKNGEEVTYSIFDYLSGPIDNQDVYTWTYPAAWTLLYYSYDKSSITLKANTVNPSDQMTVRVGNCNTAIDTKPISSPGVVTAPTIKKNYCLGSESLWTVDYMTNAPDATITRSWDITASGAGFTYASGYSSSTQGEIKVNIGSAASGYILFKSSKVVGSGCPNAERIDTIKFSRPQSGSITSPKCVTVGTGTATYTVTGVPSNTSIIWTLPTGMSPTTGTTTTPGSSITVNVASNLNYGSINAIAAFCPGTITGLNDINITPVLSSIAGPVCAARNASVTYTATASGYDNIIWTSFTGTTVTGSTSNNFTAPSNFTGGTISAVAKKGACSSASVPYNVEWDASGITLTSLTADKTCLSNGISQNVTYTTDAGYDTYTWNLPTGWSGTSTSNTITYTTNGTAGTVSVTAKNGTCGSTNSKSLAIPFAPAVTVTNSGVVNGVVTLSVPTGDTYVWNTGATTNFIVLPNTGTTVNTYCVNVTKSNGCVTRACSNSTSTPSARIANTDETENTDAATILVSPNPASKLFQVKAGSSLVGQSYVVTTMDGQQVAQGVLSSEGSIDVSGWSSGMYILKSGNTSVKIQVSK